MASHNIIKYLDEHHVDYSCLEHPAAFTAQEIAAEAHIPGRHLVKTLVLKLDDKWVMFALPADLYLNLQKLKELTGVQECHLARESEFKDLFPECEIGAMPPLGHLFDLPMMCSKSLLDDEEIAFNAGNHTELIKMRWKDFKELENPKILDI